MARPFTSAAHQNRIQKNPKICEAEIIDRTPDAFADENKGTYEAFYTGSGPEGAWHGPDMVTTRVFTTYGPGPQGCLSALVPLLLFLICLFQLGLLAAIGFAVFSCIGSLIGICRNLRLAAAEQGTNPAFWKIGNWIVSFILTAWLAGGLR